MSQIQQVKDATDIIELISERVELKRSGRNWRGLCPFHGEKTPSFFVSEQLQRYKCFGCGESGDVFTFLEKYEGMTFSEALEYLADRAGITLQDYRPTAADAERDQLLEILDLAKEYYHYLLTDHKSGKKGREYLKQRGITQDSIKLFQMGFSLDRWDGLITYLHNKKKYDLNLLVKTGLVINRRGRYYDRFRGRLMFPLKNHRGQVVGFSGRVLDPDAKEAKYINTPETQLYHKAELLFGYSELLQFIRKQNEAIVVEGEFDVVSSTQAHVNNIVAVKGSAFTTDHAKYLKRVADKVLFALDMDSAGIEATKRAIPIAQEAGLELRVIVLDQVGSTKNAKDPDELARHDPKAWRDATRSSISAYQFIIDAAFAKHEASTPEGKRNIIEAVAPSLKEISHEVEKDYYLKHLAERLDVKLSVVEKDIQQHGTASSKRRARLTGKAAVSNEDDESPTTRLDKLQHYLWYLLLNSQGDEFRQRLKQMSQLPFTDKRLESIQAQMKSIDGQFSVELLAKQLPTDLQELLFDLHLQPQYQQIKESSEITEEWDKTWKTWQSLHTQAEIAQITSRLDELDQKHTKSPQEEKEIEELLEKVVMLQGKLR